MDIRPIKTDADYRAALNDIENLMMAEPDTVEGEKLDILVTLVEAYEAKHFPMDLPDPVEAIKFEMERKGLTVKDLEALYTNLIDNEYTCKSRPLLAPSGKAKILYCHDPDGAILELIEDL